VPGKCRGQQLLESREFNEEERISGGRGGDIVSHAGLDGWIR
jgi:hypothetical protein